MLINMNAPVRIYYGVDHAYRDHSNSGLSPDERKTWRAARRQASRELRALGFRGDVDASSRAEAEAYAAEWNGRYQSAPILGPLEVYEYSYA